MRRAALVLAAVLATGWAMTARAEELAPKKITLPEAVALGLKNNPALREAAGREAFAQAGVQAAGVEKGFQVGLTGTYSHVSEVPMTPVVVPGTRATPLAEKDTGIADLAARKVIWSFGRIESLVRQAAGSAEAQGALKERTRQIVVYAVERSFRLLLAAQRETEAAQQSLAAAEEHRRTAKNRLEARAASQYDVIRAEVEVEEARQGLLQSENGIKIAHAAFLQALGLEDGFFQPVEPDTMIPHRLSLDALLSQARLRRPELGAFDHQADAAQAGIDAARGEKYPTLSLGGDWQLVTPESSTLFNRWAVNAMVTVPILDGGRSRAHRGAAEAQLLQAQAARASLLRQVEADVRQSFARAESADQQVIVARKRIEQAQELMRLANIRYEGGVGTPTEAADALAALTRAQQGLVRAQADQKIADSELRLAVGATATGDIYVR